MIASLRNVALVAWDNAASKKVSFNQGLSWEGCPNSCHFKRRLELAGLGFLCSTHSRDTISKSFLKQTQTPPPPKYVCVSQRMLQVRLRF